MEDEPGPPLSQITVGAFEGSLRASKNQKNCAIVLTNFHIYNCKTGRRAVFIG